MERNRIGRKGKVKVQGKKERGEETRRRGKKKKKKK